MAGSLIVAFVLLSTLTVISSARFGSIAEIVPHCSKDECYKIPESVDTLSVEYHRSLRKFLSGGLPQILWESVAGYGTAGKPSNVSSSCVSSLTSIWKGIKVGDEVSFRMVDSSGKTPTAFLDGTASSFGDYDQCLELSSMRTTNDLPITSQYCIIPMSILGPAVDDWELFAELSKLAKLDQPRKINLKAINIFKDHSHFRGLCLPSTCDAADIVSVVNHALQGLPLAVLHSDIHCDTKEAISYMNRIKNMTRAQIVSLAIVLVTVTVVSAATLIRFLFPDTNDLLGQISIIHSAKEVFSKRQFLNSKRSISIDVMRVLFVYSGGISHNAYCLEKPLALMIMSRHIEFRNMFTDFTSQAFTNEAGLTQIPVLSGFAVFYFVFPLIKANKFPVLFAIISRYINMILPIIIITCMEFLWPLLSSGPFYSFIGNFLLDKCTKNWWRNLLLINNFLPPLEICVCQTYFSSTIFQLFILSIPVMYTYSEDRKLGRKFAAAMAMIGYLSLAYFAYSRQLMPSMFVSINPDGQKTVDYLETATINVYGYMAGYFFGLIVCDYVMHDFQPPISGGCVYNIFLMFTGMAFMWIATYSLALFNVVHILPFSWAPFYMPFVRFLLHVSAGFYILWMFCLPPLTASGRTQTRLFDGAAHEEMKRNAPNSQVYQIILNWYRVFDEWLGLCNNIIIPLSNISVAFYLTNYFFIRLDFFSSRILFTFSWWWLWKRTIYAMILMTIYAFIFHVYFVAPFDIALKFLIRKVRGNSDNKNCKDSNNNIVSSGGGDDVKKKGLKCEEEEKKTEVVVGKEHQQ